jgi:D-alanyl-D-alanine carboxypeptidase (penicillin-binding protein 5/6)
MTDKFLIFGISLPQMQAARSRLTIFSGEILPFLLFVIFMFTAVMLFPPSLPAQTRDDSLHASFPINSYIVKERGVSTFLMAKDIERAVSPASLTKILTCIIAIESGRLDEDVLITKEATMVEPSKAGFKPGDRIKLIDLVKAAMVNSSNDAAFAIAIHLSGTVDSFVAAMNYRAQRIGMKNSRFTNPAGFDKDSYAGNISTAEDMLRLTEYAVKNPVFNQVARLEQAVFTEQTTRKVYCLKTHNKLLDKYPYAVGIKTGYTSRAGRCLIARAIKDNRDILLVMLNAKTDRWNIAADMFDSVFSINRPNTDWLSQTFRGNSGASSALVMAASAKAGKRAYSLSKSGRKSKRHVSAGLKAGRKSKHADIAGLQSRKSKRSVVAGLKHGNKLRKRIVVSSKPVKKNRKRVSSSYTLLMMRDTTVIA